VEHRLFVEIHDHRHELEAFEIRVLIDPESSAGDTRAAREPATDGALDDAISPPPT